MIKGIITDFDGTLVDTLSANVVSYINAFGKNGFDISETQYRECFGLRFDDMCNKLNIPNDKELRDKIKVDKKNEYAKHYDLTKLNYKLFDFIMYSKTIYFKVCIASTASQENLTGILQYYNIQKYFDNIVCGNEVKKGKPAPDVYMTALSKIGLEPNEVIVFEDSLVGIDAAKNAGIDNIIKINSI